MEYATRLLVDGMKSFKVSPTASTMVISSQGDQANKTTVRTYKLFDTVDGVVWEQVDPEISFDESKITAISLAKDIFAVASPDAVEIFSYGGRKWGEKLEPREASVFTSIALSFDGRTLAAGSVVDNGTGTVDWYNFPSNQDTGDDWQAKGPLLRDEWQSEGPALSDEYGKESPMFGSKVALDGEGRTIIIQSGKERNENVHFYSLKLE
jgi:hypothetical protein